MINRIVFPSLAKPAELGYSWHRSYFDVPWRFQSSNYKLHDSCGVFETYGDRLTQHSPERPVACDLAIDYLASLAAYLADHHDEDTLECLAYCWPNAESCVSRAEAVWAMGIKFKEGKRQYYSVNERKVSTSESKQHDKRWERVPEWADGTLKSGYQLVCSRADRLDRYAILERFGDWAREIDLCGITNAAQAELAGILTKTDDEWKHGREESNNLNTAFGAVDQFAKAHRAMNWAKRQWECLQNNYVRNVLGIESEAVA